VNSRTVALLTALAGLTSAFAAPRVTLSPGPQSEGHAKIEGRCFECHSLGRGTPRAKCIACHELDRIGADDTPRDPRTQAIRGMHRSFTAVACGECHSDHRGRSPSLATRVFSHEALSGALRERCSDCHGGVRPADALHRQLSGECGSCHATTAWKPATFAHERWFVLDRDHAVECRTCHDQPGDWKRYTCYGCHEHSPARMQSKHREEGISGSRLDDCVRCHRSADEHEGGEGHDGRRGRGRGDDD
jgi:hypothetical protein